MKGLVFGRTVGSGAGFAAAAIALVLLTAGCAGSRLSNKDAWCTQFTGDGSTECSYRTLQQCLATISGVGGICVVNPRYADAGWRG